MSWRDNDHWRNEERWRGLIILCSGVPWDGPWMVERHLASALARYAPVLFVDPPRSVFRMARSHRGRKELLEPRLREVGDRLARLTPLALPGVSRPVLRDFAQATTRHAINTALGKLGGDVHAVIVASFDDHFGRYGERFRVLYGTDDFAAGGQLMRLSTAWLIKQERAQLRRVNRVVAVSDALAERWREMGFPTHVIPNGCDAERYASVDSSEPASDVTLPGPIAGVIGHLSERLDIDILEAVAATGRSLLLVGPRQASFEPRRMESLLSRPNVQWVGPKPSETLPSYLRLMTVGLTPYADSAFNRASFPLKTLEYLAAGLACVSSDLPASRWLGTDLIEIGRSPADFARATIRALDAAPSESERSRRQTFAQRHSWNARAEQFLRLLDVPLA